MYTLTHLVGSSHQSEIFNTFIRKVRYHNYMNDILLSLCSDLNQSLTWVMVNDRDTVICSKN